MASTLRLLVAACAALLFLAGPGLALPTSDPAELEVRGLPADLPFTLTATASELELVVDLAIEDDWHLYARDVGGGQPVSIEVTSGGAFAARGALATTSDTHGHITGAARLVLPLERVATGDHIEATFAFQVCDALMCLLPMEVTLVGVVPPLDVLLVVAQKDETTERVDRIEAWLTARGFAVTTIDYTAATQGMADAADVIVADSNHFRKPGSSRAGVREFPRTKTPIVAVGYLGTELVEAHGVAMTSGYI